MSTLHTFGFNVRKAGIHQKNKDNDHKEKTIPSKECTSLKRIQPAATTIIATEKHCAPSSKKNGTASKKSNVQSNSIMRYLKKKSEEDGKRKQHKSKMDKEQIEQTSSTEDAKEEEEEEEEDLSRPLRKEMTAEEACVYIQQITNEILQGSDTYESA
ncbi:hypothetical protein DFQ29_001992 [Apophysomyces sp. BC1021]|nr:hypothetical protein DFQ29_001992 [Apophysomyces sp. BC1021]